MANRQCCKCTGNKFSVLDTNKTKSFDQTAQGFAVVVGGIASFEGPIIGTILFFLRQQPLGDMSQRHRFRSDRDGKCAAGRLGVVRRPAAGVE